MLFDQDEYENYARTLTNLVFNELVPKVAVFDYFTEHVYAYEEDPLKVEPLLWFMQSGLSYDVVFSLFRLFDRKNSDRNLIHFLNYTRSHFNKIVWKIPFPVEEIATHELAIAGMSTELSNLTKRRNKWFGHYDKEYFIDPRQLDVDFPFSIEDAKALVRVSQAITGHYHGALSGKQRLSLDDHFYRASEKLYSMLRSYDATSNK